MVRLARAEIFDPSEIVAVLLIGKTVRSCYLMGGDERSGKNFDHRKRWIEDKLKTIQNWTIASLESSWHERDLQ